MLAPYVRQYWFLRLKDVIRGSQRTIPFGSSTLHFLLDGNTIRSVQNEDTLPQSYFYGQTTRYEDIKFSGTVSFIAIVFQPTGAQPFFNIPMHQIANCKVPLSALGSPQLLELEKQLSAGLYSNQDAVTLIEVYLLRQLRLYNSELNRKRLSASIQCINNGGFNLSTLSKKACLGDKQFRRLFTRLIGINPKDFVRITRYQMALHSLHIQPNCKLSSLAEKLNYYDKSHLIREVKEFTGFSPKQFLHAFEPYSEYHALFRAAYVDNQ